MRQATPMALLIAATVLVGGVHARGPVDWACPDYPNLLRNRSFEGKAHGRRDNPTEWQVGGGATWSSETTRSGRAAVRFAGPGWAGHGSQLLPDTEYEASVWVRAATGRIAKEGGATVKIQLAKSGDSAAHASSEPLAPGARWQRIAVRSEPPPGGRTYVRIVVDGPKSAVLWADDASLAPTDGELAVAPALTMSPAGGTFEGPAYVTLAPAADFPGGTIRYTMNGTEPNAFSAPYSKPLRITGSMTLKARVFHDAYRPGPVAEARFELKPHVPDTGVPLYPIRWGQPVEQWWSDHVYNPESPNFVEKVASPEPRVNVADVRDAHPGTTTAGIAEALAKLPASGGTLWFPKDRGPYELTAPAEHVVDQYGAHCQVAVLRRSNLHFVSDGAVIRGKGPVHFLFASMNFRQGQNMQNPVTNLFFQGLVFDGMGEAAGGVYCFNAHDVLVEDCAFRNMRPRRDVAPDHVQTFLARACCENVWLRRCRFESGGHGAIVDGLFNGGVLDSFFEPEITSHPLSFFPNTDMNIARRQMSSLMRHCRYVVVSGNTFQSGQPPRGGVRAVDLVASEALVTGNRATGYPIFVGLKNGGIPPHNWPNMFPGGGLMILDNSTEDVRTFASAEWQLEGPGGAERPHVIGGNTATGLDTILRIDHPHDYGFCDVEIRGNRFQGQKRPQIVVLRRIAERVHGVRIGPNEISGEERPLVVDERGQPLDEVDVRIEKR